ncbi:MAG: indolepyruvate oxidoreductase subunit beta [Thermodesulfobacteriota bacterium]|nr:indolepyruvate oxidoreductase subunit beta [Thermodesulfobacteriota bacterium]
METKRLIIVAVGGQGNLLASKVLAEAAMLAGVPVRMSEIHGMAQRGGVVESALVFGDAESTIISDGCADVLVAFEPAEALRAIGRCNKNTAVVTNVAPTPPFTVAIGKGVYPDVDDVRQRIAERTARLVAFDANVVAVQAGNPLSVNIALLGALIQTGVLPVSAEQVKQAIATTTKPAFVDVNLKAFDMGFAEAAGAA